MLPDGAGLTAGTRRLARGVVALAIFSVPSLALAQEIEPRTYSNAPTGLNFVAVGYVFQVGNVFFDAALPIEDVNADLHIGFVRYLRTLAIGGKPARLAVVLPGVSGHWDGFLDAEFRTRDASGIGDVRMSLDVLVWGARARRVGEAPDPNEKTIVGLGFAATLPTGTYDNEKLINLGSNRWSIRPQIGVSRSFGRWTLEGIGAAWLYSANDDFFGGQRLTQDSLLVGKVHAVYSFSPGMWVGFGAGYGEGATTRIDGVIRNTLQTNWRFGGTFAYAVAPQHGISLTVMSGLTTRVGADFDSFGFAYQYQWGQ